MQELDFFAQKVNDGLDEVESKSFNLAMDTAVQENLQDMLKESQWSYEYNRRLYKMRTILLNEMDPLSCIQSITYIDPYGIRQEVGTSAWTIPEESMDEFLKMSKEAGGAFVSYGPTEDCPYLIAGRQIRNRLDMGLKDMGTIVLICDVSDIIAKNKSRLESDQASIVVYSRDGVIYKDESEGKMVLPESISRPSFSIKMCSGPLIIISVMEGSSTRSCRMSSFRRE